MRSVLANVAVAAAVGVAAAAIAAASGFALFSQRSGGKKTVHATISLERVNGTGACFIWTEPQTLEAFKRETIEWTVVDRCGVLEGANEVSIAFANDPLDPGCVKRGKKKIRCALNNPDQGFYKYVVSATNATTEDPEIEIVQ